MSGQWLGVWALALLAYLPALFAAPGKMPSDTKLYLYLDPGRLIADAPYTWDNRQFAGWVPHQTVTYLWPSGPWYWLFDVAQGARLDRPSTVDRHAACSSAVSVCAGRPSTSVSAAPAR